MISIGFGDIFYYNYSKEPPKPYSNHVGPDIIEPYYSSLIEPLKATLIGTPETKF